MTLMSARRDAMSVTLYVNIFKSLTSSVSFLKGSCLTSKHFFSG